jgi:hypothetical protein
MLTEIRAALTAPASSLQTPAGFLEAARGPLGHLLATLRTLSLTVEGSLPDDGYGRFWFGRAAWGGCCGRMGRWGFVAEWAALPAAERV